MCLLVRSFGEVAGPRLDCGPLFEALIEHSTCVGRPFGITDQVITTDFPSILDDVFITKSGFSIRPENFTGPSYKRVSHHYFRLRLLQSEILQVLQYRQAQKTHENKRDRRNEYMHTRLSSSFLQSFPSFNAWRKDVDRRLWEWNESAPLKEDINVEFSVKFLELNYWQAVIMLYRQSLGVPPSLAKEVEEVASPLSMGTDEPEDEDDIYLKVAEAGQRVLKLCTCNSKSSPSPLACKEDELRERFILLSQKNRANSGLIDRQLHRIFLINYTYLATVHLFMAGIAFLYAIWHSTTVRSRLTLTDVEYTVHAAISVLGDLVAKCPPAEACKDAFDRMSKTTIKMCLSTTGFKPPPSEQVARPPTQQDYNNSSPSPPSLKTEASVYTARPPPRFDMNLQDLFPGSQDDGRSFDGSFGQWQSSVPPTLPLQPTPQYLQPANVLNAPVPYDANMPAAAATKRPSDHHYEPPMDWDFLLSNEEDNTAMYGANPGIDLGFVGDHHNWVEGGAQVDLFDGFFFGGTNGTGQG